MRERETFEARRRRSIQMMTAVRKVYGDMIWAALVGPEIGATDATLIPKPRSSVAAAMMDPNARAQAGSFPSMIPSLRIDLEVEMLAVSEVLLEEMRAVAEMRKRMSGSFTMLRVMMHRPTVRSSDWLCGR